MRILRIRRGFTTNSSGANEYLSKDGGAPAPHASSSSARAAASASAAASTGPSAAASASPSAATSASGRLADGGPSRDASAAAATEEPTPQNDVQLDREASCQGGSLFTLAAGVLLLFVVDRVVRVIRRRGPAGGSPGGR